MSNELDDEFFPIDYDLNNVFNTQLSPLLKQIVAICDEYDIPMIVTFQTLKDGENVELCTSSVLPVNRTCSTLQRVLELLLDQAEGID